MYARLQAGFSFSKKYSIISPTTRVLGGEE